jgi:hypothetical protein
VGTRGGTRLGQPASQVPKCLLDVGGKLLIQQVSGTADANLLGSSHSAVLRLAIPGPDVAKLIQRADQHDRAQAPRSIELSSLWLDSE